MMYDKFLAVNFKFLRLLAHTGKYVLSTALFFPTNNFDATLSTVGV